MQRRRGLQRWRCCWWLPVTLPSGRSSPLVPPWACILPASSRFLLFIPSICSSICSQSGRGCGGRGGSGGDSTGDFRPSCLPCCFSSSRISAPPFSVICSLLLLAPSFIWRTARSSFASLDLAIQQNLWLPTFMPSFLHLFPLVFTPFPGSPTTLHRAAALTLAAADSRPRSILGFSALPPS